VEETETTVGRGTDNGKPPVALQQLLQALQTDHTREPFERETSLNWSAESNIVRVHTAEKSIMRRLLHHPEFTLERFAARTGDRGEKTYQMDTPETGSHPDFEDWREAGKPDVLSINGTIPIGCVSLTSGPRTADGHAEVVSKEVLRE
jgi:hypothetical protein